MSSIKKSFRELFDKSFRRKNRERSAENALPSDFSSKQSNQHDRTVSQEARTVIEQPREIYGSSSIQNSDRKADSKTEKLPMLSSLSAARRQLREVNLNPAKEYYEDATKLKNSSLYESNQTSRRESKVLTNESQLSEEAREYFTGFKIPKSNTINPIPSSDSRSKSKDLPNIQTSLSKSSLFEEKVEQLQPQNERDVIREKLQPKMSIGSSENSNTINSAPLARIQSRSEAYLQKTRDNLAKDLNSIKLKESNKETHGSLKENSKSRSHRIQSFPIQRQKLDETKGATTEIKKLGGQRNNSKQPIDLSTIKLKVELSVVEENSTSAKNPNRQIGKDVSKIENVSINVSQPEFTPVAWRRFEIDSTGLHQKASSFESEIEKIGQWSARNSCAMANLVAIRESLMQFYFKGTIKIQTNNIKC